ncbi:MAG: hypothetical protein IJ094_02610 [Bacilli bacterium]|nr:hypothetical protein [Bacilli bacterium]
MKTEKEIILKTINVIAELMDNPCSFRKFLENLGLENKDYEDLYNARGMYLTDIATLLGQQDIIKDKLNNIRRILTSTADKYDIDESMDNHTLVGMVAEVILEIQDIKEFMDKF